VTLRLKLDVMLIPSLQVFGAFTNTPWAVNVTSSGPTYFGNGECFLYRVRDFPAAQSLHASQRKVISVFQWTRQNRCVGVGVSCGCVFVVSVRGCVSPRLPA
jgi:hypothetical protein